MTVLWFISFSVFWTGFLYAGSILLTAGSVKPTYAQSVWRGAAALSFLPWVIVLLSRLFPAQAKFSEYRFDPGVPILAPPLSPDLLGAAGAQSHGWITLSGLLISILMTGWVLLTARYIVAQRRLQTLKSHSTLTGCDGALEIANRLNIAAPQIRYCETQTAFVAGIRFPAIFLPLEYKLSSQPDPVITHECVHIVHGDLISRPLERIIAFVFWFSPFAWLIRSELDHWREVNCDRHAASLLGDRKRYARALINATTDKGGQSLPASMFHFRKGKRLNMRIRTLMDTDRQRSRPARASFAVLAGLLLAPLALAGESNSVSNLRFSHPVLTHDKASVTARFGRKIDPISKTERFHKGIDIKAPSGAPIYSPVSAIVTFSGDKGPYGNIVELMLEDGSGMRFAHLKDYAVERGDTVKAGQKIARLGNTGRSTGPHVHIEYWNQPGANSEDAKKDFQDPETIDGLVLIKQ